MTDLTFPPYTLTGGVAYRELNETEGLLDGDEVENGGPGVWRPSGNLRVGRQSTDFRYRRRVDPTPDNYRTMQSAWLSHFNVGVGSRVRVVAKSTHGELGWDDGWDSNMDAEVGKTGVLKEITEDGLIIVEVIDGDTWSFPFHVLAPVEEQSVGERAIEGLQQLADDLTSGKPIKATRMTHNGDGTFTRTKGHIVPEQAKVEVIELTEENCYEIPPGVTHVVEVELKVGDPKPLFFWGESTQKWHITRRHGLPLTEKGKYRRRARPANDHEITGDVVTTPQGVPERGASSETLPDETAPPALADAVRAARVESDLTAQDGGSSRSFHPPAVPEGQGKCCCVEMPLGDYSSDDFAANCQSPTPAIERGEEALKACLAEARDTIVGLNDRLADLLGIGRTAHITAMMIGEVLAGTFEYPTTKKQEYPTVAGWSSRLALAIKQGKASPEFMEWVGDCISVATETGVDEWVSDEAERLVSSTKLLRCDTCHGPRSVAPCHKCGGPLREACDGWEEPRLPSIDRIRELAKEVGYAIGVHGSLERDLDLIAIPWSESAVDPKSLAQHIASGLPGTVIAEEQKPLGRWSCNIQATGYFKLIDLSVAPSVPIPTPSAGQEDERLLYVVMERLPCPESDFVELETASGRGVGPNVGIEWTAYPVGNERTFYRLGPFVSYRDYSELQRQIADDDRLQCCNGCRHFTGGDVRHHPSCKWYPESLTKMQDDQQSELTRLRGEVERLTEWKSSVLGAIKQIPEFTTGEWGGDKEGWGFCFELIRWITRSHTTLTADLGRARELISLIEERCTPGKGLEIESLDGRFWVHLTEHSGATTYWSSNALTVEEALNKALRPAAKDGGAQ